LTTAQGQVPALIVVAGERAGMRFLEFFAANIRNHTRAGPMPAQRKNSSHGARPQPCRRWGPYSRCASPPDRGRDARARCAEREEHLAAIRHRSIGW